MMRVVTFKIDDDLLEAVDGLASFLGETRSEVIRRALQRYVYSMWREIQGKPQPRIVVIG